MRCTRETLPTWWNHLMWVGLGILLLCISACATPGHSLSNPSAPSTDGGLAGPLTSGDGDGSSGM
jgi:hypothetical protein